MARWVLVVNVASKCGFTPQYAGLEDLWRRYRDAGLMILGFPCNQFGEQEPGNSDEIAQFCSATYDVTFPIFAKVDVNGAGTHPIYKFLKSSEPRRLWYRGDQVELHQVPCRSWRQGRGALRPDGGTGGAGGADRAAAVAPGPPPQAHSMPHDWDPTLYLGFADERTRPAHDLLAQVPLTAPRRVVDLGCGPGNSTALLVARYPAAAIVGLDTSPAMLAEARRRVPAASFAEADARAWTPEPGTELLFANAVYQWVPDHLQVIRRHFESLAPGAVLALQMPDNLDEPTHRLMIETAAAGAWAERLHGVSRRPLPPVRDYYAALSPLAERLDLWHSTYNHVLADSAAIVRWVEATGLAPFLAPLSPRRTGAVPRRLHEARRFCLPAAAGRPGAAAIPAAVCAGSPGFWNRLRRLPDTFSVRRGGGGRQ